MNYYAIYLMLVVPDGLSQIETRWQIYDTCESMQYCVDAKREYITKTPAEYRHGIFICTIVNKGDFCQTGVR